MSGRRKYKRASTRIARRNKIKKNISLFLKISLPIVLFIGFIFLTRAEFLQVKNFKVLGAETVTTENIKNTAFNFILGNRFLFIPKSNIIFLNKEKLTNLLLSKFTRLKKVEIDKHFFNKSINIKVIERKAKFKWCTKENQCFFMTKDGLVFEKILRIASSTKIASNRQNLDTLIIFKGLLKGNPLMKNFATPEEMQSYLKLVEIFKKVGFKVSSINIKFSDKAIAKTNVGDIIFNPKETNLSLVTENTILLINKIKNKNPSAQFDYIDARFGNKFYYKLR